MRRYSLSSLIYTLCGSAAGWAVIAFGCLWIGSQDLGWPANPGDLQFRLRSVLMASLIGAALAAAGVAYQAILRNPLADPYLLGVSSGASLAAYLWRIPGFVGIVFLGAVSQQVLAFAGALLAIAIVLGLASHRGRIEPVTLLLVGVIVNALSGSLFLLINALRPELMGQGGNPMLFLVGGLQDNLEPEQRYAAAALCLAGFTVLLALAPQLNVAALSDTEAQSLGVRIGRLRWTALITASLMTAAVVAVSGPIGFVGLVCPHLARRLVGHDARRLLPLSAALGASLLALAETSSRAVIRFTNTWPPVGVITSLIGGPFFLYLLYRQRRTTSA